MTDPRLEVQSEALRIGVTALVILQHSHLDLPVPGDGLLEGEPVPGRRQIHAPAAVTDHQGPADLASDVTEQLLGEIHQFPVGGIGPVELHHGEFGVVLDGNPFIAEIPVDFKNPVETAHHQTFQIQLRRDPQEQIHFQGVVMGHKRFGRGSAGDRLHHRGFHLEIIVLDHEIADQVDDPAARAENLANLGIGQQIEITLPIAGFHIGQAVPFFGKRQQRFGEQSELSRP